MVTKIEKYGASFCGPCKVLDKTLENVKGVEIIKYDVEEYEDLAAEKGIRNVPVMIFYDGDTEVDRIVGAISLDKINETINSH